MKSIGIITIQKSPFSYGANFQAYALWNYVSSLGYNCEIIDLFRPVIKGYIRDISSLNFSTCPKREKKYDLKDIIKSTSFIVGKFKKKSIKQQRFESFFSLINYSIPFKSITDLYENPPIYDYYISGSDQIWNPDMPFENEPYLLSFITDPDKCISYASSFGRDNLPEEYKANYSKLLLRYKNISVRETTGSLIIDQLIGKKPNVVIDPTMLFDGIFWHSISIQPTIKTKYLLCFSINSNEGLIKYALKICKAKGLFLVSLSGGEKIREIYYLDASDSGPKEWLGWFENAEHIITDSFHGTVFSILFKKTFYSFIKDDKLKTNLGCRIENLLIQLSLENRILNDLNPDMDIIKDTIQYDLVYVKLEELKTLSKNYLKEALG